MTTRSRRLVGVLSGVLWGLGGAILTQQAGLRSLDPMLLYGSMVAGSLVSWAWAERGRRKGGRGLGVTIVGLLAVPMLLGAGRAPGCAVEIELPDGEVRQLGEGTIDVDDVGDELLVHVFVPGAEDVSAEVWVEVGGFRIPVKTGVIEGGSFDRSLVPEVDFSPFATPGLYHIGGTASGVCTVDGLVRIGGSPFTNPIGQAAAAALLLGLVGTWVAGRPAPSPPDGVDGEGGRDGAAPTVSMQPRHIEARIYAGTDPSTPVAGFVPGATHRVEVAVGAVDGLPVERGRLTMVLSAPGILDAPHTAELERGDDSTAFQLDVPVGAEAVEARITAVSGGRIVQTAMLPSAVHQGPAPPSTRQANVATAETTVRPMMDPGVQGVAGAFLVGGRHGLAIAGGAAAVVDFDDVALNHVVARVRDRLTEIVEQPGDFEGLDAPGTTELLVFLAHQGRLMRDALVSDHLADQIARARRLQVASSRPDAYFPFELAYDFPAPDEAATVCPEAAAALASPVLEAGCPGTHDSSVVCPLGFWGVSRVIERHSHQPGERLPTGFVLRSNPRPDRSRLSLVEPVLVGASARVDAFDERARATLDADLAAATGHPAPRVDTWAEWRSQVTERRPSVLVLLPHTVHSETLGVHGLEIGESDRLWAGNIDAGVLPGEDRPVVAILLGCDTALAGVGFERFPGLFRRAGAEIVVGTIAEVLGRHAAPVAADLVSELFQAVGPESIGVGEAIVRLRRRLLAQGRPMVLTLAAFGDADWELAVPP